MKHIKILQHADGGCKRNLSDECSSFFTKLSLQLENPLSGVNIRLQFADLAFVLIKFNIPYWDLPGCENGERKWC